MRGEKPDGREGGQPGATGAQPAPKPGEGGEGTQPGVTPRPGETPGQQSGEGSKPDGQAGDGPPRGGGREDGSKTGSGMERMVRELKRAAEGRSRAQRDMEQSRQMQEMARKMLEESTPEQREEWRKLAEEMERGDREGGERGGNAGLDARQHTGVPPPPVGEGETQPVDTRRGPENNSRPPERVIAEWYSDKPVDRTAGSAPDPGQAMRAAAAGAERAIEQQAVPPRYSDLVRRVFRRYSEEAAPK